MTYASLGFYDRRESHPANFPACATAAEKAAAKKDCQPTVIAGLGAALTGSRFAGANPCWVETLPDCPTCLTQADLAKYSAVVYGTVKGLDAVKIAHLRDLFTCGSVTTPALPTCLTQQQRDALNYCAKYPNYNGPDANTNAGCWAIQRFKYGGIGGGYYSVAKAKPDCPKCLTEKEAMAFADCIRAGQAQRTGAGIPAICSDPRMAWTLCPDVKVPALPQCLDRAQQDIVAYCRKTGGTDNVKNAACYLFQRSPDYWRGLLAANACPPVCVKEETCWDGTKICRAMQAPGDPATQTTAACPPRPAPAPVAPPPPPERKGLSTGSVLLLAAAAGGGLWLLAKRKKKAG